MSYASVLSTIICEQYQELIEDKRKRLNNKGLLIRFSISAWDDPPFILKNIEDNRYPSYELLIFGETNYVGVYIRDTMLHPEEKSEWYCLSYHDSCWRTDGVREFVYQAEKYINTIKSIKRWFSIVKIFPAHKKILREAKRKRHEENIRHPLLSYGKRKNK